MGNLEGQKNFSGSTQRISTGFFAYNPNNSGLGPLCKCFFDLPMAPMDESGETIPKRLQVLTTDEAYQKFHENYKSKVGEAMKRKCEMIRSKHSTESDYNKTIKERLNRMEKLFPSKSWFISRKPQQTKMNQNTQQASAKTIIQRK